MGVVEYRITRLDAELALLDRQITKAEEEGRALLSEEAKYSSIRRVREEAKARGLPLVPEKYIEIESIPIDPRFEK
jgi:cell division protein FtsL